MFFQPSVILSTIDNLVILMKPHTSFLSLVLTTNVMSKIYIVWSLFSQYPILVAVFGSIFLILTHKINKKYQHIIKFCLACILFTCPIGPIHISILCRCRLLAREESFKTVIQDINLGHASAYIT